MPLIFRSYLSYNGLVSSLLDIIEQWHFIFCTIILQYEASIPGQAYFTGIQNCAIVTEASGHIFGVIVYIQFGKFLDIFVHFDHHQCCK